jgi:hypothetical protein
MRYPEKVYYDANGNKRIRSTRKYMNNLAATRAIDLLRHYGWDIETPVPKKNHSIIATKPCD